MNTFKVGWTDTIGGLQFRVVQGYKGEDDLRLEWLTPTGWWAVPMRAAAMMTQLFFENEDRLYPPDEGFQGGEKFMRYLADAVEFGYDGADKLLRAEKAAKRRREAAHA